MASYQLLVTQRGNPFSPNAGAIHQVVIGFDTVGEADIAYAAIKNSDQLNRDSTRQVIKLYSDK